MAKTVGFGSRKQLVLVANRKNLGFSSGSFCCLACSEHSSNYPNLKGNWDKSAFFLPALSGMQLSTGPKQERSLYVLNTSPDPRTNLKAGTVLFGFGFCYYLKGCAIGFFDRDMFKGEQVEAISHLKKTSTM